MLNFVSMSNSDLIVSMNSYLLGIELRLFWGAALLYGLGLFLFIIQVVTRMQVFGRAAKSAVFAALVAQAGVMALRAFEAGRLPVHTGYETLSVFAISTAAVYLYTTRRWKGVYLPGVLVTVVSLGACLYALFTASPAIEPLSPLLRSRWFEYRQLFLFFSYAVFSVSASVEATCLIIDPSVKKNSAGCYGLMAENIRDFHASARRLVLFGYPFLTFAIFSGAVWGNSTFGAYWSWGAGQTWSLVTWTVFTMYLHSKSVPALRGIPASAFNITGFFSILLTTFLGADWLAGLLGIPALRI